jgi:hypothetical protein
MTHVAAVLALTALGPPAVAMQAPSPPAESRPAPVDGSTVTVTGCLRAGEQPGTFVLDRVMWNHTPAGAATQGAAHHETTPPRERPAAPAEVPRSGRGATAAGAALRLAGAAAKLKLSEHLGHTVTLTGMLVARDPVVRPGVLLPDTAASGDTTSRTAAAAEGKDPAPGLLNVRSMTHVAGECR